MEQYRTTLRRKQAWLSIGALLVTAGFLLTGGFGPSQLRGNDFVGGFQTGFFVGVDLILVAIIIIQDRALRDPDRLRRLQLRVTDERNLAIQRAAGSTGMAITLYALAAAAVIAGNYNATVFYTLMFAIVAIAAIQGALKLYYHHRY